MVGLALKAQTKRSPQHGAAIQFGYCFKGLTKDSSPSILIARQSSSNTPSSPSGKPCFETKVNKVLANQSKLDLRIYQMAFSFVPIL